MQSTALFTNFTEEEFTGYWDGKGKTFKPGQTLYMPDYLARHFAKHLVNRELVRRDDKGNLIYPDGEKMTSPKRQEDVPLFMKLFNKAYKSEEEEDIGSEKDDVDALIASANANRAEGENVSMNIEDPKPKAQPKTPQQKAAETRAKNKAAKQPQIITPPDFEEDEADDK